MSALRPEYRAIPDNEAVERESTIHRSSQEPNHKTYVSDYGFITVREDGSYNYSYGPGGLLGLKHNYYALLCAFFASIGGLEFGYDQGVIANVLVMKDFVHRWPVTPLQKGIMTAVLELGALMGALTAGVFADRSSRGMSIVIACIVFCIGSTFQCAATTLGHVFIGRAVGGIGVVPGSLSWRIPLGIQLVPGIILAVGCYFLPPSPRLLVLQGQYDDALNSLAKLRLRTPEEAEDDPLLQTEKQLPKLVSPEKSEAGKGYSALVFARGP
ncbi:hypothetical protein NP233_g11460 [Leucocoprinus birnbaumii]|uniref:Major facilitator superfamily (MFS) profile domain-containing protein n=1 Tax=Leucocoprinus birnbaumii TaxID=56174 RepID=A0AAD5YKE6_9AGAR|nr:hypothetical protein NP233_g11460 [Leucocoprinus birnbaumii]